MGEILFVHVTAVTLLVTAVVITTTGVLRAQRARTAGAIATAMSGLVVAERVMPPAVVVTLISGLWLAHDEQIWSRAWLWTAMLMFAVMSVLGPTVELHRSTSLLASAQTLPPATPITPELDRLRRDPTLVHVLLLGSSELVAILYLMSVQPHWPGAVASVTVAATASFVLARLLLTHHIPVEAT